MPRRLFLFFPLSDFPPIGGGGILIPMDTVTLTIDGMHCGHCVAAVKRALEALPGVVVKDVDIGTATVEILPEDVGVVRAAIEEAGYFAEVSPS